MGVLAPASIVQYQELIPGLNVLKQEWGLKIVEGTTLKSQHHQFSASDQQRQQDLQAMLDNPEIKAIIAARGGYGCSRIIDQIDFTTFLKQPKWIVGFSDLTALHSHIQQLGVASIHGPMVKSMMLDGAEEARGKLKSMLFGKAIHYRAPADPLNRTGHAQGILAGGNLCLLSHLVGSSSDLDMSGKILFIEDVNEYLYNLDRMMLQLKRAGKLANLAGLIVGQFTDMKDNEDPAFGQNFSQIIAGHVAPYHYPVAHQFPAGHVAHNLPLCMGAPAHLEVTASHTLLTYTPTAALSL